MGQKVCTGTRAKSARPAKAKIAAIRKRAGMAVSARKVTRMGVKITPRDEIAKTSPICELESPRSARRTERNGMIEPRTAKERKNWGLVERSTESQYTEGRIGA